MPGSAPVVVSRWHDSVRHVRRQILPTVGSVKPVAHHSLLLPSLTCVLPHPNPILHDISLRKSLLPAVPSKGSASKLLYSSAISPTPRLWPNAWGLRPCTLCSTASLS